MVTPEGDAVARPVMGADGEIVFKVLLSGHVDRVHTYHISAGQTADEVFQLAIDVVAQVTDGFRGVSRDVYLWHPATVYAADKVLGDEVEVRGPDELQTEVERAHRQVGFRPPESR